MDLFEEMATIARPPLAVPSPPDGGGSSASGSKRPLTDETGYIVCLYKVFRGDDGEKFERNWLFWTGERARRYRNDLDLANISSNFSYRVAISIKFHKSTMSSRQV